MMKKSTIAPLLLFLVLSGILIFCWFRFGHMYGGGDTGLPTYNPITSANIASNIWYDSLAPGIPVGNALTVAPASYMLSIPQSLGASPVFIQALLFFILLFLMGYGMYLLALSIFGKSNYFLAIAAGVFYLFNPYMMIQIWHRFIHNSMFFVAFLPFLIMTWRAWIQKRSPIYLLLFLSVNFLAVYTFGTIAFIVAIWALLFLLTLLESLVPWKGRKNALKLFLAFLIGCFFWILTNSWWLIPTFNVSPALFASVHSTDGSLSTLMSLSASTILPYTLRLINPFYLYWQADFGSIYQSVGFLIISWLFVLVVVIGFIRGLREKAYTAWSLLALVVIFLSKGAAPPFNFPYIWGFANFFPLGVIRNPFEKLGIILPLVYAILFSLGLQFLLNVGFKYIGKSKTYFLLIIFILLHMAFFWPMFAGKLFGTLDKQNFVEVPKSYTQANDWIKQDIKNTASLAEGRILHLPLSRSEGVTYNWDYGYNGVEPSAAIFTSLPSIARGLDIPGVNDVLSGLSLIFHKPYASNPDVILKMLQDFSIKYILLHKDIEWKEMALEDPEQEEVVLNNLPYLKKRNIFGNLIIYEVVPKYFQPKIIVSNNFDLTSISTNNGVFWPWLVADINKDMVTALDQQSEGEILNQTSGKIILPTASFPYKEASGSSITNLFSIPSSGNYELVLTNAQSGESYSNKLHKLNVAVDGVLTSLTGTVKDQLISFGDLNFTSGQHEVIFLSPTSINLFPDYKLLQGSKNVSLLDNSVIQVNSSPQSVQFISGELLKTYGGDVYRVSFDYKWRGNNKFYLLVVQDTDPDKMNPQVAQSIIGIGTESWQNYNVIFNPLRLNTQKAVLEFALNPEASQLFGDQTSLQIRNIRVERLFNNLTLLRREEVKQGDNIEGFASDYQRINAVLYKGRLKLLKPSLVIFKETYHPGWKLELSENNLQGRKYIYMRDKHYLGNLYANAWYIEKGGEYNFKISFKPQNYVNLGITIAALSYVGLLILLLLRNKRL